MEAGKEAAAKHARRRQTAEPVRSGKKAYTSGSDLWLQLGNT